MGRASRLFVVLLAAGSGAEAEGKPIAMPAGEKEALEAKLRSVVGSSMGHLAWMLGVRDDQSSGKNRFPDVFRRYELKLDGADSSWRHDCAEDLEEGGADSLEHCAVRKLQALGSLCAGPPGEVKAYRRGLKAAMRAFNEPREVIPFVGILRDSLPPPTPPEKAEGFIFRTKVAGAPGAEQRQKILSPLVQAVAMAAAVRCGEALGDRTHLGALERWFVAAERSVASAAEAKFGKMAHQELGTIWHNLAFAASRAPRAVAASANKVVEVVETEMWKQFSEGEGKNIWSFEGAAAIALRMNQTGLKKKVQKRLRKIASSYKTRFVEKILPTMDLDRLCTCGPTAALARLAVLLEDSKLVAAVIELIMKDAKLLQVQPDGPSAPGAMPSWLEDAPDRPHLEGAFLRSPAQLDLEKRPRTLRIDDTFTCLDAANAALRMVEAIPGVDADEVAKVTKVEEGEEEGASEEEGDAAADGRQAEL